MRLVQSRAQRHSVDRACLEESGVACGSTQKRAWHLYTNECWSPLIRRPKPKKYSIAKPD